MTLVCTKFAILCNFTHILSSNSFITTLIGMSYYTLKIRMQRIREIVPQISIIMPAVLVKKVVVIRKEDSVHEKDLQK